MRAVCCAVLCSDGMATIGEELSDEEGGLRVGEPGGAFKSAHSGSRQYQPEPDEHDFDSTRGSM